MPVPTADVAPVYDVVVIGSGVAGALIAYQLAGAGRTVLILEAGDRVESRQALKAKYALSPSKYPSSPYTGLVAPQPYFDDPPIPLPRRTHFGADHYVHELPSRPPQETAPPTRSQMFMSDYLNLAGGSTWHWQGLWVRMLPRDFKLKQYYQVGEDWPITYQDLEGEYALAEQLLGVSGDHAALQGLHGAGRSRPFPMPPIAPSYADRQFKQAVDGVIFEGTPLTVTTVPQAKNALPYDGRAACEGRSSCIPLCPIDAKYEANIHLERAVRRGATLLTRAVVFRLEADVTGSIARVHYRRWDGVDGAAVGRVVVVAANGIETPRLLLNSPWDTYSWDLNPWGRNRDDPQPVTVANRSDQVGRNLMDHPVQMAWGLAKEPVYPFRGPPSTSSIESLRDGDFRRYRGGARIAIRNDGWFVRTGAPLGFSLEPPSDPSTRLGTLLDFVGNERLFGRELVRRLRDHASRQILIGSAVEMLPNPDNRVRLDAQKDRLGIPRPRLTFQIDDYTRAAFRAARRVHQLLLERLGVTEMHLPDPDDLEPHAGSSHLIGTTRMGTDPTTSVVDANCQAHDHPNLYIVGSSVFPTATAANPTATIAALALRAATHVAARF